MLVVRFLFLLIACIGNAEWWVILINRQHSLKFNHKFLRRTRIFHDLGITVFPVFCLWIAFRSNGLLRGGSFAAIPSIPRYLLSVAAAGFVPFTYSVLRWHLTPCPQRISVQSRTVTNLLEEAKTDEQRHAIAGDLSSALSRMPWNQIWQLESNVKHIDLSGSQPANFTTANSLPTNSIHVAHFSDLHLIGCPGVGFFEAVFDQLAALQPDFYCFTGDLADKSELLPWAINGFDKLCQIAPVYFILGNHDWHIDHREVRTALQKTQAIDLGQRSEIVTVRDTQIQLAGTEAPWIGSNPQVPSVPNIAAKILLSHTPDQRNYAVKSGFDLMLCGHNHGGQVVLPLIGPVYSPSLYGVKYAGGCHEASGMLMHISRGLAGKDTLRWNCRPEISLLKLQFARESAKTDSPIG